MILNLELITLVIFNNGNDVTGSSSDPCSEEYRGSRPFSEKETLAIKNFIETHSNIKMAINFFTYGNMYVTPFNFENQFNARFRGKSFFQIYQEFENEANLPSNAL